MRYMYDHRGTEGRENRPLNAVIERYIEAYDGPAIGQSVRNMYENGSSYEAICDCMGLDYNDYKE